MTAVAGVIAATGVAGERRENGGTTRRQLGSWDLVVVGGGVAGLAAVRSAARRRPGARIALVAMAPVGAAGASVWAQGGVAAAVGEEDHPALHAADTLAVAGGLADATAVEQLTVEGRREVLALAGQGTRFDRTASGGLALGREAAHGRSRILHAQGDATGAELVRALGVSVANLREVTVLGRAVGIATAAGPTAASVVGLEVVLADGEQAVLATPAVVLATGGSGQLWSATTNPPGAEGSGLALAARAGALVADLEMVQFHPTALAVAADPLPLLSEAIRGEGAIVVDGRGRRFLRDEHPLGELGPRDVVASAVYRRVAAGEPVFLDARAAVGERFPERFPSIFATCAEHGLDPRRVPLPITPAAHYHMGGVLVDLDGRSSLPGLWAVGEVASTGVHGANRLASNSLLEALVWGARAGADAVCRAADANWRWPVAESLTPLTEGSKRAPFALPGELALAGGDGDRAALPTVAELRQLMWRAVGVERDGVGLAAACRRLAGWRRAADGRAAVVVVLAVPKAVGEVLGEAAGEVADDEQAGAAVNPTAGEALATADQLLVAHLIAVAAAARRESRGSHQRRDCRQLDPGGARRMVWGLGRDGAPALVGLLGAGADEEAGRPVGAMPRGRASTAAELPAAVDAPAAFGVAAGVPVMPATSACEGAALPVAALPLSMPVSVCEEVLR